MPLILICLSVFLIPMASLLPSSGAIIWWPQYIAFLILGFLAASSFIWKINKSLAVLFSYCAFSYIFVCNLHPRSMLCLLSCGAGIVLICLLSNLKKTGIIYKSIILAASLQAVLVIFQSINIDPFFHLLGHEGTADTVGFVGSHNQLGLYYAAITPFFLQFFAPLVLVPVFCIFVSHCSSAAIGMFFGVLAYGLLNKKYKFTFFLTIIALVATISWKSFDKPAEAFKERVGIWKLTCKQITNGKAMVNMGNGMTHIVTANPLTGFGIGSFLMISPKTQDKLINPKFTHRYEHAHNDMLEFFFEYGYLGLLIIIWLIFDILWKFFASVKTSMLILTFASLLTQGVSMLGVYVVHAPVSLFMLCLTLGLFYAEVNNASKSIEEA